jgi:hypothetical protein
MTQCYARSSRTRITLMGHRSHPVQWCETRSDGSVVPGTRRPRLSDVPRFDGMDARDGRSTELETDIGTQLLNRHARGMSLTQTGAAFLDWAREILRAADEAVAATRQLTHALAARVATRFVPPVIDIAAELVRAFGDEQPGIELQWCPLDFAGQERELRAGTVDVASLCNSRIGGEAPNASGRSEAGARHRLLERKRLHGRMERRCCRSAVCRFGAGCGASTHGCGPTDGDNLDDPRPDGYGGMRHCRRLIPGSLGSTSIGMR